MKRFRYLTIALGALPVCVCAAFAAASLTKERHVESLQPMQKSPVMHLPQRTVCIDGFFYEDFENVADGESALPAGWVTTSTPGNDADQWSAGTLGKGDTPLNGVSGYKYAFILGNKDNDKAHDSWLFSPTVRLMAGEEYEIEFFTMMPPVSGSDVMEKMEVCIGSEQNAASMTKVLEIIENDNDYWRFNGYRFTPETTGNYCLGFHSLSPAGSNSTAIDDVKISNGKIPVFSGSNEIDMGKTDTRVGQMSYTYYFENRGQAPLEITLTESSPELNVEGLPKTIDEYAEGSFTITLTKQDAGDYTGHVKISTNDPTLSTVDISVQANVTEARITGYCFEDFEQGGPEGWDLGTGSGNVAAYGGLNSSRAWFCSTFYQDMGTNEEMGGVGFTTHYIEMGDNPELKFWYQLINTDMMGSASKGAAEADVMQVRAYVSDDGGISWSTVYTIEPGGEHEHKPSLEFQQVAIPLPQYAGKTCRVRLVFTQVKGMIMANPVRVLVDDVEIGTQTPANLEATSLVGATTLDKGREYIFRANIANKGAESISDYEVRLVNLADNTTLATSDGIGLEPSGKGSVTLNWTPDMDGTYHLAAEIVSAADQTPDDNISYPLHAVVLPSGNSSIAIGTEGERYAGMYYPVNFYGVESISQSILYANELGINRGTINSMVFTSYMEGDFFSEPVSFYIAETDRSEFSDNQFVDENSFTKVFEGKIYFEKGMRDFVVPFDTPYEYKGGNIVVMGKKSGKEFIMGKYFMIRQTLDKETKRSINLSTFTAGDLSNGTLTTAAVYPEMRFNMVKADAGKISGRITDTDGAVSGAIVKVAGSELSVVTDHNGDFTFPNVAVGDVKIEVSKHGYYTCKSESKAVTKGNNTDFSLEIKALPRHTMRGKITSKANGQPVEGVKVTVKGYDDFSVLTDADGDYVINDICGDTGSKYSVRVFSDFFKPESGVLEIESDIVRNYVLYDKPLRVHNLKAFNLDTEVNLTWDSPMPEFAHDSGIVSDYIGWAHGQSNVIVASVFHNHAKIKEISWFTTDQYGWHGNFNVFIFGLDADGNPDVKNILYVARNVDFADNQWSTHILGNPVEADGFMIAVSCDGFLGIGITEPTDENPFEEGQSYYAGDNYEWGIFPMSNYKKVHPMLRAYGENLGDSSKAPAHAPKASVARPESNYKVFRFAEGEKTDNWKQIGTSKTTSFRDKEFASLEEGKYRYAVKASYSGCEADPVISETIEKSISGINSVIADGLVSLSPNPFVDAIHISNPELVNEIHIFTTAGNLCGTYRNFGNSIDTSNYASGIYIVNVILNNGKIFSERMIK